MFKLDGSDRLFQFGQQQIKLSSSDAVCIDPFCVHSCRAVGMASTRLLTIYLDPEWLRDVATVVGRTPASSLFARHDYPLNCDQRRLVYLVAEALSIFTPADLSDKAEPVIGATIARLIRSLIEVESASIEHPKFVGRRLRVAVQAIARAHGCISVGSVARTTGISRSEIFTLFSRELGTTPKAFADSIRAEHALRLIAATDMSLGRIAADLNFNEHASFTRFVRRFTGVTQIAYRKALLTARMNAI